MHAFLAPNGQTAVDDARRQHAISTNSLLLGQLRTIAVLGNHLPRQCGIATFTTDLSTAISTEFTELECFVVAMNDPGRTHAYPPRVRFEIAMGDVGSYRRAADFLNVNDVDLVSVQHEYGIFGGKAGSHLFALLRELRMPIVSTLHTILAEPNSQQREALDELTQLSERLVVMSENGRQLLHRVHGVALERISLIPHGIPTLPNAQQSKNKLGLQGKSVILTFGLLSPDKGIEYVIDALPSIVAEHPDAIYVVLGATHPHVKERHGESYRLMLEARAHSLGVESHIIFHDRFVSQQELTEFLAAADIYITPYLNPEQITSGTLAYALGSGKAVVSTPYSYAKELLAEGRGLLVEWPKLDGKAIGQAIHQLLSNASLCASLREKGAQYGRNMLWPDVARSYVRTFEQARELHQVRKQNVFQAKTLAERPLELPEVNLDHLCLLSDATGILQHAAYSVPRYEDGYCLDDNARALLLMSMLEDGTMADGKTTRALASRYLAFVNHAFDRRSSRFRNFMSYSRQWIDERDSEDCHGRALWGLGSVIGRSEDPGRRSLADVLFHASLFTVEEFRSPRAWAYALLGIDGYLQAFQGDIKVQSVRKYLAERLFAMYLQVSTPSWSWFENSATYCNARLSQALIVSGARMENEPMKQAGVQSLKWLAEIQSSAALGGYFAPIGSNGFFEKGGVKASFDQQPVEACAMVSACLSAAEATHDQRWVLQAHRAFRWFLGQNERQQPLYIAATGACRDGLHADRLNENQGAESTLSFLMSLVELRNAALPPRLHRSYPATIREGASS